jgi:hypothetical protein
MTGRRKAQRMARRSRARKSAPEGPCHLCAIVGKLSFEHVPPRSAFNDRPLFSADSKWLLEEAHTFEEFTNPRGTPEPEGAAAFTLCERCNNVTGSWYGPAYVGWAVQGREHLSRMRSSTTAKVSSFSIFPARVLKMLLCMFASANPPGTLSRERDLQRFVLDRDAVHLPPQFRVYCFLMDPDSWASRQSGPTTILDASAGGREIRTFSEIAFPPFGYVLCFDGSSPPAPMQDITWFADCTFGDHREVHLELPVLPICSPFPGDYRSAAEVAAAFDRRSTGE